VLSCACLSDVVFLALEQEEIKSYVEEIDSDVVFLALEQEEIKSYVKEIETTNSNKTLNDSKIDSLSFFGEARESDDQYNYRVMSRGS